MSRVRIYLIVGLLLISAVLLGAYGRNVREPIVIDYEFAVAADFLAATHTNNPINESLPMNKFGYNFDADFSPTGIEESIWDTSSIIAGPNRCWTNTPTAQVLYISSTASEDETKSVTLEVLDANYVPATVTIALGADNGDSGTDFVQVSATPYLRVNRAYATTVELVGIVYIHLDDADAGGVPDGEPDDPLNDLVAIISKNHNQTLQACYTVPAGMAAVLEQFCVGNYAGSNDAQFLLRKSLQGNASLTQELLNLEAGDFKCVQHKPGKYFDEKTDIELTVLAAANNTAVSGTFDMVVFSKELQP